MEVRGWIPPPLDTSIGDVPLSDIQAGVDILSILPHSAQHETTASAKLGTRFNLAKFST